MGRMLGSHIASKVAWTQGSSGRVGVLGRAGQWEDFVPDREASASQKWTLIPAQPTAPVRKQAQAHALAGSHVAAGQEARAPAIERR